MGLPVATGGRPVVGSQRGVVGTCWWAVDYHKGGRQHLQVGDWQLMGGGRRLASNGKLVKGKG